MQTIKNLGIWMDHANAYYTEFTTEPMTTNTIVSAFTHQAKIASMVKSEALSHHKEQKEQLAYYKDIEDVIIGFDHVLLFGPTKAKFELYNLLKEKPHLDTIQIEVESTDKMTKHEQQIFIRNYFTKKL